MAETDFRTGIIGAKLGMTQIFAQDGRALASPSFTRVSASCCRSARLTSTATPRCVLATAKAGPPVQPPRERRGRQNLKVPRYIPRDPPRCQAARSVRSRRGAAAVEDLQARHLRRCRRHQQQGLQASSSVTHGGVGEQPRFARSSATAARSAVA